MQRFCCSKRLTRFATVLGRNGAVRTHLARELLDLALARDVLYSSVEGGGEAKRSKLNSLKGDLTTLSLPLISLLIRKVYK